MGRFFRLFLREDVIVIDTKDDFGTTGDAHRLPPPQLPKTPAAPRQAQAKPAPSPPAPPCARDPNAARHTRSGFRRYPNREERAQRARDVVAKAQRVDNYTLSGKCWVIDGDTIVINHVHIRLAGIDAPELDHPWGQKSKWELVRLCKGQVITAHVTGELSHNRVVATCRLPDGRDLAAELVKRGLALDWSLFSGGKYRKYETADARKRMWRAACRQTG